MRRAIIEFDGVNLTIDLLDTPTAGAVWAALPFTGAALTWGEEVYFTTTIRAKREPGARTVITPGEVAFWPEGNAIAIGYGRTPISRGDETRLAGPCNVWATTQDDVRRLSAVKAGSRIALKRAE